MKSLTFISNIANLIFKKRIRELLVNKLHYASWPFWAAIQLLFLKKIKEMALAIIDFEYYCLTPTGLSFDLADVQK